MTQPSGMTREQVEAFLAEPRNAMVAAIRAGGRPQMTPNWLEWDGTRFYISTTKTRRKHENFRRDPRVQLAIDDATGFRTVLVDGTVEIREELASELGHFRTIYTKYGRPDLPDDELLASLEREHRVLLVITPEKPLEEWTNWGA